MSLLNEMLKDLDRKMPRHPAALAVPSMGRSWVKTLPNILCGIALVSMFSVFIYVIVYWERSAVPLDNSSKLSPLVRKSSLTPINMASTPLQASEPIVEEDNWERFENNANEMAIERTDNLPVHDKIVQFTKEDWHDEHMNKALEAIQEGNDELAMDLLTSIITKFPASITARENLAALYFSHEEFGSAYEILEDGLKLQPHNLRLITMKARLLVEQGQQHKALLLLEKFNPDINAAPEYYAVVAAIFESLGRTTEAGSIYQTLIKLDPANGQYWLGLGIAFEHKHSNQQAIEAYKRASQDDTIQPSARSYAENRLKMLQG